MYASMAKQPLSYQYSYQIPLVSASWLRCARGSEWREHEAFVGLCIAPRVVWTMGQSDFWICSLSCCSLYPHSSCSKYPLLDVWRNISAHSACSAVWEWSESDLFGQCRCVAGRSPLVSHPLSCALSWILRLSHFSVVSFPVKVASSSIVSSCTHLLPFHWSFWSFSSELRKLKLTLTIIWP